MSITGARSSTLHVALESSEEVCTGLGLPMNLHGFPLTALYGVEGEGFVSLPFLPSKYNWRGVFASFCHVVLLLA